MDVPVFQGRSCAPQGILVRSKSASTITRRPIGKPRRLHLRAATERCGLECDLILDLTGGLPLFTGHDKRDGYFPSRSGRSSRYRRLCSRSPPWSARSSSRVMSTSNPSSAPIPAAARPAVHVALMSARQAPSARTAMLSLLMLIFAVGAAPVKYGLSDRRGALLLPANQQFARAAFSPHADLCRSRRIAMLPF